MKNKKIIIDTIFVAIFATITIISLVYATGAVLNAKFAIDAEVFVQKKYALYDFNIVTFATLIAVLSGIILIAYLVFKDNKTKTKKKKIIRR